MEDVSAGNGKSLHIQGNATFFLNSPNTFIIVMFNIPDPILLLKMEDHEWLTDTFRNLLRDLGELICAVAGQIKAWKERYNIWKKAEGMMRCPTVIRFPFLFHLMLPNNDNFLIALKDSFTLLGVYCPSRHSPFFTIEIAAGEW